MVENATASITLSNSESTSSLPIQSGSLGPDVIDIRTLHKTTGTFTYDPGFTSTQLQF